MEKREQPDKYKTSKKRKYRWRKRMKKGSTSLNVTAETANMGLSRQEEPAADVYDKEVEEEVKEGEGEQRTTQEDDHFDTRETTATSSEVPHENCQERDWLHKPGHTMTEVR